MRMLLISTVLFAAIPVVAFAHSGGTDQYGCHTNHQTGEYHCHKPKGVAAAPVSLMSFSPSAPQPQTQPVQRWEVRAQSFTAQPAASFANCAAARAAGAAPVRLGEPGYGRHLDRDGDGVGCE
jgi:hypothetical protein